MLELTCGVLVQHCAHCDIYRQGQKFLLPAKKHLWMKPCKL